MTTVSSTTEYRADPREGIDPEALAAWLLSLPKDPRPTLSPAYGGGQRDETFVGLKATWQTTL